MTAAELVERSKRQLNAGAAPPHTWPENEIDLMACVMQAISNLANEVMRDNSRRTLLQQAYSVSLDSAGVGDPLAAIGSITGVAGEILMDGVKFGAVVDAESNVLQPLVHYADFLRPQAPVYGYYCLADRKILTRAINTQVNTPLDIIGVSGPLSITANFEPAAVDSFPSELEADLVNALVRIVAAKIVPANA